MKKFVLVFLGATGLWGGTTSVTLKNAAYTSLSGANYNNIGSYHIDIRIHNWGVPGSIQSAWCGPVCFDLDSLSNLSGVQFKDTAASTAQVSLLSSGGSFGAGGDVVARFSRDIVKKQLVMEAWDPGTGVCLSNTQTITVLGNNDWTGITPGLGDGGLGAGLFGKLAFVRWYPGPPPPLCTQMPTEAGTAATILDNEFENSLTDSAHNLTLTLASPTYTTTPLHGPVCFGQDIVGDLTPIWNLRANFTAVINPLQCNSVVVGPAALAYAWTLGTCPNGVLSNANIATPSVSVSLSALPYRTNCVFHAAVSDNVPNTINVTTTAGVVISDAHSIVQTGIPLIDDILGPMLSIGAGTPNFEKFATDWGQHVGLQQAANPQYQDDWNTSLAGHITLVTGNPSIVGVGTTFKADLCGGGTSEAAGVFLVPWVLDGRAVGGSKRGLLSSFTCPDDLHVLLASAYNGPGGVNIQYSKGIHIDGWVAPSENVDYYCNICAFYVLAYRTGLDVFMGYARTLADRWFTLPEINQGLNDCNVDSCVAPRIFDFTGLVLRALDGRPEMWTGLRAWVDLQFSTVDQSWNDDIREDAYRLSVQALCGMADPDPTHRATCQSNVVWMLTNLWTPQRLSSGSWTNSLNVNPSYSVCSWTGCIPTITGTVTAVQGSDILTLVGSTWGTGAIPSFCTLPCNIWLTPSNASAPYDDPTHPRYNTGGDSTTFKIISFIDSTHARIDRPYDGILAGTGRGYSICTSCGLGTQPFMMGVVGAAMDYCHKALRNSTVSGHAAADAAAMQYTRDAALWMLGPAMIINVNSTNVYGPFYFRNSASSEPYAHAILDPNATQDITTRGENTEGIRYLNMETMHALCMAYLQSHDSYILNSIRHLFNVTFGNYDAYNVGSGFLNIGTFDWNTIKAKNNGFAFGWGLGSCADAVIQTTPGPQSNIFF